MSGKRLSIGQCATLACLLEVATPKPGNVHRSADFEDVVLNDFLASAVAIAPAMDEATARGVGSTVLSATRATRDLVDTNTNLGSILLLAPLAAVPSETSIKDGIATVLASMSKNDARDVYQAIGLASPGGLNQVDEMDINDDPPDDLLAAMRAASERDVVARQFINDFADILERVVPWLLDGLRQGWRLTESIIHTHVRLMGELPDSLIARKCGIETAQQSAAFAKMVLDAGTPTDESYQRALADLDFWLRSDHHRRNPGTTADLIAAGLFVALREEFIEPPFR